jgi:hypothetical protein
MPVWLQIVAGVQAMLLCLGAVAWMTTDFDGPPPHYPLPPPRRDEGKFD